MSHPADVRRARAALQKAARAYAKAFEAFCDSEVSDDDEFGRAMALAEVQLEATALTFAQVSS